VVVAAGEIEIVPANGTEPTPPSIETEVAPVTVHNRLAVPPTFIEVGTAVNATIVGGVLG